MVTTNFSEINKNQVGEEITVGGFVHSKRDHGGLIFIDLRSESELLQCVADPERSKEVFEAAEKTGNEYVLKITGVLNSREDDLINPNLPTGEVELDIKSLVIVSKAKTLPFNIHEEGSDKLTNEDTRLKYRYLDFRRKRLKDVITKRSKFVLDVRNWFDKEGFVDVPTPILANSSPEGARDYLVPSRIHPGKFFALPQAPQQFKQLLMIGGFNKYVQIAPCFRDEDPRADRLVGDFYQIDAEIAWADEEYIYNLSNRLINDVFTKHTDKELMDSEMIRINYDDAMNWYGSDKPDLRYGLKWQDAKEVFKDTDFKVFTDMCSDVDAKLQALHIKGAVSNFSRSDLDKIQNIGRDHGLPGIAYIQYTEEGAKSPIFKFLGADEAAIEEKTKAIKSHFGAEKGDLILFIANKDKNIVYKAQHQMRVHIAKHLDMIDDTKLRYVWIEGFPMFEEEDGKFDFAHNPFGLWKGGLESLEAAKEGGKEELLKLRARQYDIAVNGYEVLSGGVRNPYPEALSKAFEVVGYSADEIKSRFGHMMQAYEYGAPVHAGFAWGVPRNIMVLFGEENVREVVPFPKNGSGSDPMTNSPSTPTKEQLKELGLIVDVVED